MKLDDLAESINNLIQEPVTLIAENPNTKTLASIVKERLKELEQNKPKQDDWKQLDLFRSQGSLIPTLFFGRRRNHRSCLSIVCVQ